MNEQIEDLLYEINERYSTFDPFVLAEEFDINIKYVDFLTDPLGQYRKILGSPYILLSQSIEDNNLKYFVAAHELHHALVHEDILSYYSFSSKTRAKVEMEANKFSAAMCFNLYIEEQAKLPETTVDLLNEYGVPLELSEILL
ncbi:ImmA/IrrE family metallo-endopeptidase [Alkalibacterium sp. MB6]|uniref:ImmA/IrrE family metallo-endopeptidase n=1 Tax=Alkalibacterium sp. MB6 TaxID=2081965 RepID=UPI00137ADE61|nr:ImmA/IrrE family metallo-endopeptidase [Alkalibacterium sp. MB6]